MHEYFYWNGEHISTPTDFIFFVLLNRADFKHSLHVEYMSLTLGKPPSWLWFLQASTVSASAWPRCWHIIPGCLIFCHHLFQLSYLQLKFTKTFGDCSCYPFIFFKLIHVAAHLTNKQPHRICTIVIIIMYFM